MIIGLIVLIGLFLMSRVFTRTYNPVDSKHKIPLYTDDNGKELSSIKADFPAKDGGSSNKPTINASFKDATVSQTGPITSIQNEKLPTEKTEKQEKKPQIAKQYVLFISAPENQELDGSAILQAMSKQNLSFGDMDIFHYLINDSQDSLFRVANGVAPWTLVPDELANSVTPGLSVIFETPVPLEIKTALQTFITVSRQLADTLGANLLNQQQEVFTERDELLWITSAD
ncbi:MAG: Cell division protein ZipA [uncultured Thiotrichaceae bacterium]|uniref:Cell division protein ZipA n=1 Tax=uncultured Thiotrichaceae bacterium TaxID=298394 RepID=A0A6S6U4Y3_9GAMM|nr:MAG: Cell division protein ZipA [uncultured Thiotrichaceae bacterium]